MITMYFMLLLVCSVQLLHLLWYQESKTEGNQKLFIDFKKTNMNIPFASSLLYTL